MLYLIFAAIANAVHVVADLNQTRIDCLDHGECAAASFCATSSCNDALGRKYLCGLCMPCNQCLCNSDAVDGACPINKCPAQPTDSVRFLQGPLFARMAIPGASTHVCVRRLLFDAGSFFDVQAALRIDHPASAKPVNISSIDAICPAYTRAGLILGISIPPGEPILLQVIVTSEGTYPRRRSSAASIVHSLCQFLNFYNGMVFHPELNENFNL